jgi:MYXO-CTERM domain-containing protein
VEGWKLADTNLGSTLASSADKAYSGTHSLSVKFNGQAGSEILKVELPKTTVPALDVPNVFSARVFIPSGTGIVAAQTFVIEGPTAKYAYTGNYRDIVDLKQNDWNLLFVHIADDSTRVFEAGISLEVAAGFTGTVYIDTVSWLPEVGATDGGVVADGGPDAAVGGGGGSSGSNGLGGQGQGAGTSGAPAGASTLDSGCACRASRTGGGDGAFVLVGLLASALGLRRRNRNPS